MRATMTWADAVEAVCRTLPYDRDEATRAAEIAQRGKVPNASTPEGFVRAAEWCASGGLYLYGYLAVVEQLVESGSPIGLDDLDVGPDRRRVMMWAAAFLVPALVGFLAWVLTR